MIARSRMVLILMMLGFALQSSVLPAQVVNPADAQKKDEEGENKDAAGKRLPSWEMPPVVVRASGTLREEDRIGSYAQPRWTATRRFPGTRVYVVPEGKVEVEYWIRPTFNNNEETETRTLWEIEFGLPHRFQIDLYMRSDQEGDEGERLNGEQIEVRYAFADWGKLWGNPTLYLEWVNLEQRPDKYEPKLLLGGEIAQGWHWGTNFVAEMEQGGEKEHEYAITGGVSRTVIDSKFSLGGEAIVAYTDVRSDRGNYDKSYLLGPSIQFRPLPAMTLNVAPLIGLTEDSPDLRVFFNLGWEL